MAIQRTFSIIKPDATRRNLTGAINAKLEAAGLRIIAQKRLHLTRAQAEAFYAVHKERPFFGELTEFISSAPIVAQVLEGEDAIAKNREVMGATNPAEARRGHHPQGVRALDRRELGARLRRPRHRRGRDRLLLLRPRARRLIAHPEPVELGLERRAGPPRDAASAFSALEARRAAPPSPSASQSSQWRSCDRQHQRPEADEVRPHAGRQQLPVGGVGPERDQLLRRVDAGPGEGSRPSAARGSGSARDRPAHGKTARTLRAVAGGEAAQHRRVEPVLDRQQPRRQRLGRVARARPGSPPGRGSARSRARSSPRARCSRAPPCRRRARGHGCRGRGRAAGSRGGR